MLQGANMFFLNSIFKVVGLFNEHMGAGTEFHCEDLDMGCRASYAGFTGAVVPDFTVYHNHGRKHNSAEALKSIKYYDFGRGAYYANLMLLGFDDVWKFWQKNNAEKNHLPKNEQIDVLSREMIGASKYLDYIKEKL
jgi:GT2 family glycosyltransferase